MRILIFGQNGQVGRRLYPALLPLGDVATFGSQDVDLKDETAIRSAIQKINPNIIVNAAAFTAVDKAEECRAEALSINAHAPKVIAEEAYKAGSIFVHYSTDYVFDGTKASAYSEDDEVNPINFYGQSKAEGDSSIASSGCRHLIIRTSWVYDSYGKNFPKTILSLAKTKKPLRIVGDQFGSPTSASLIASSTAFMLYKMSRENIDLSGAYNLVSDGYTNWYGFASYLLERAENTGINLECKSSDLVKVCSEEYKTAAVRPSNSMLDTSKISNVFGLKMPMWQLYVDKLIEELKEMRQI